MAKPDAVQANEQQGQMGWWSVEPEGMTYFPDL